MRDYHKIQIATYMAALDAIDAALKPTDAQVKLTRRLLAKGDDVEIARAAVWAWQASAGAVSRLLAKAVIGAHVYADDTFAGYDATVAAVDAESDAVMIQAASAYREGHDQHFLRYITEE